MFIIEVAYFDALVGARHLAVVEEETVRRADVIVMILVALDEDDHLSVVAIYGGQEGLESLWPVVNLIPKVLLFQEGGKFGDERFVGSLGEDMDRGGGGCAQVGVAAGHLGFLGPHSADLTRLS